MQSNRPGLALALDRIGDSAARDMAAWLAADGRLALADGVRLRRRCRLVLRLFSVWLRDGRAFRVERARALLKEPRAREIATSFLLELAKQEGWLERDAPRLVESFLLEEQRPAELARPLPLDTCAGGANSATQRERSDS
jgi:hypothetical protein